MPFNFDRMVDQIADLIAERALEKINERVQSGMRNGVTNGNGRRVSTLNGRKLDMHFGYPGCKHRLKRMRLRLFGVVHLKVPKVTDEVTIEKAAK